MKTKSSRNEQVTVLNQNHQIKQNELKTKMLMNAKTTLLTFIAVLCLMVFSQQTSIAQCCNVDLGDDQVYCGTPITIGPLCMAVSDCICCTNTPVLPNGDMVCDSISTTGVCYTKLPRPWSTTFPTDLNVGYVNPGNSPILTHSGEYFTIPFSSCGGAVLAISFAGVDTLAAHSDVKTTVSDLCIGNDYEVCWEAWTSDASVDYDIKIAGGTFPISNVNIWQQRCITFTALSTTEVLQFYLTNDTTTLDRPDVFIDCAKITEVNCGGGNAVDYQWNTGASTPDIIVTSPGTYCLTITDCSGCKAQDCVRINSSAMLCTLIGNNPNHPDANGDCDNGGVDNYTECQNGGNPNDPADDCQIAVTAGVDICLIIGADPTHPMAKMDCDSGGVDNYTECMNGGDPADPADDCESAIAAQINICTLIGGNPSHPMAVLDCDNGGVPNYTECLNGEDPSDPADDCQAAIDGNLNICVLIAGNPNHPMAALDCDNGGVPNYTECLNGEDPSDPADDCQAAIDANLNICILIGGNPSHPLAALDCDNGGIDNYTECNNGGDPSDPADDCDAAINAGVDICAVIGNNPNHPLAQIDCDNGGIVNYTECIYGEDPSDPADDCQAAIDANVDICATIGIDQNHPLATKDCDNGGVDNYTECQTGEDPANPADDCQSAQDSNADICIVIGADPNHPMAEQDCDNGGVPNYEECMNGGDPNDPADDCDAAVTGEVDICALIGINQNHPLATLDCDNGGISNYQECITNGADPLDPADDCLIATATNLDICAIIGSDPNHPLATLDCDDGGVTNYDECQNGGDPDDSGDDCQAAIDGGLDICVLIGANPNHPLATLDCDDGGVDNYTECQNGGDPIVTEDDCEVAAVEGVDICAVIGNNPNHPWATMDCDRGGVDNQTECQNGVDPNDPIDDSVCAPTDWCVLANGGALDICSVLTNDPNHPIATLDCDGDGVLNPAECADGTDPLDPCDFDPGSITGPVTADQSDCENLCPDLTPVMTILPGNIAGTSAVDVAVEVNEINLVDTDGSPIVVRVPSDPRYTFVWDIGLTTVALTPVQNSQWNYLGNNGLFHAISYNGPSIVINSGDTKAFGFKGIYDPQATDGQTTFTATIVPFSGGECKIINNTDSERMVYFE